MHWFHDPVDPWISPNGFVLRVNKDDLKVFVGRILVDPIRIEDSKIGTTTTNPFFGGRLEGSLIFQLVDTLVGRFACYPPSATNLASGIQDHTISCPFRDRSLATTSSDTDTIDDISLFGFITQSASLVWS